MATKCNCSYHTAKELLLTQGVKHTEWASDFYIAGEFVSAAEVIERYSEVSA